MSKRFGKNDYIKANRKGSRDAELENSSGWTCVDKKHKSIKDYDRNPKYKILLFVENE